MRGYTTLPFITANMTEHKVLRESLFPEQWEKKY
jgi:hypothetical protein